jgi:hypothetical protein
MELKLSKNIAFPDKCVFCGRENPDITVPLSPPENNNGNSDQMALFAVPSCKSCMYAFNDQKRQITIIAFTMFLVIFTGAASYLLNGYAVFLYIAISAFLIALFSSRDALKGMKKVISIRKVNSSSIIFRVLSDEYLNEFLALNEELRIENSPEGD